MNTHTKPSPQYDPSHRQERGTYSTLTTELITQIELLVKDGMRNKEIYTTLGIPFTTWYSWLGRNTKELAYKITEWRREYLLDTAEQELTQLITEPNPRIRLEAVKHLTETLGKQWYSKRQQHELLRDNEGAQLEPENKEKLYRLLFNKPSTPAGGGVAEL